MSRDVSTGSSRSLLNQLPTRSTTNTQTFLKTCVINADHKALEEHLMSNLVQQSDLNRCLLLGLEVMKQEEKELSDMAPVLTLLLQSGAKWNSDVLLYYQNTPYHIICKSSGDHHELLDLMIKSSRQTIINIRNYTGHTALSYAVCHANINCLKCLIANGADVNIGNDRHFGRVQSSPLLEAIRIFCNCYAGHSSANMSDIFDVLLQSGVDMDEPFEYCTSTPYFEEAIYLTSIPTYLTCISPYKGKCIVNNRYVYCIKELINKGARLNSIDRNKRYVWSKIAMMGNIELLKCMFNQGLDIDAVNLNGLSILSDVVYSGNIEAVQFLLDLGVNIPTVTPDVRKTQCKRCKGSTLIIEDCSTWLHYNYEELGRFSKDPCMIAIRYNMLEVVKLLEEYGSQCCKSFTALRRAVVYGSVDVVSYLVNKYTYPLNTEYIIESCLSGYRYTLLSERKFVCSSRIAKLLLDHGADPAKSACTVKGPNAIMIAICHYGLNILAQYIRSGVDVNFRAKGYVSPGNVLPFEASVLCGKCKAAEMLLISGCSCGVFSLDDHHEFKDDIKPEVEKLMKEWKVQENNVTSLKQRCRSVILNQLSPRADKKIRKLQLPGCLIKFLRIPEIDDIVLTAQ